jgi:hypothetical protein
MAGSSTGAEGAMTRATPLAAAIRRKEWERAALLLLIGLLEAARNAPSGTIDDVLAMLSLEEDEGRETQITQISQMARAANHRGHRVHRGGGRDEGPR